MSNFFDGVEDLSGGSFELIPENTIVWARVELMRNEVNQKGNKEYSLKLHILGKYEGSFVFDRIIYSGINAKGNANDVWAKQRIKAILDTSKIPLGNFKGYDESADLLNGAIIGVKLKHGKPKDDGKVYNEVKFMISPTKDGEPNPDYLKLVQEQGEPPLASVPAVVSVDSIDDEIPF